MSCTPTEVLDNIGYLRRCIKESSDEDYWQTLGGLDVVTWVPSFKLPARNQATSDDVNYTVSYSFLFLFCIPLFLIVSSLAG